MTANIAIVGCGPAGVVSAICFAQRGASAVVFDAGDDPSLSATYNPDRSYAIDITGHGLNAIRHIDAVTDFDAAMIPFNGVKLPNERAHPWNEPGWIGSRGDIMRVLMKIARERHGDKIAFVFGAKVADADFETGSLRFEDGAPQATGDNVAYDLIVAADGAGSTLRAKAAERVADFSISSDAISYYSKMLALDCAADKLDKTYLHVLSLSYPMMAGAVNGPGGPADPLWFCQVPFAGERPFKDPSDATRFLRRKCPLLLELASEKAIASFAEAPFQNIGRSVCPSRCSAGKVVFIGDAAHAYPPIGQGANAAMEAAIALDRCVEEAGGSGVAAIPNAIALFDRAWRPEADAIAWIGRKMVFTNKAHLIRALITNAMNRNVHMEARRSDMPFSTVKRRAQRMWPIWAF